MSRYFTKVLGWDDLRAARTVSPAEAWSRATPGQRANWFPLGAPTGKAAEYGTGPSGPAWDDGPAPADLARAMAAGKAALQAGYGMPTRPDGRLGCGHCVKCDGGRSDLCRQPQGKAEARLRFAQAAADRVDAADAAAIEVQRVVFAEEQRRGLAF